MSHIEQQQPGTQGREQTGRKKSVASVCKNYVDTQHTLQQIVDIYIATQQPAARDHCLTTQLCIHSFPCHT